MNDSDARAIGETMLAAYRAAAYAKDVDAFARLYDESCVVFDMWGQWSYEGVDAWRGMVSGWFGSVGDERIAVEFDDVKAIGSEDLVCVHAFVTYKAMADDGRHLRAMTNRLSWLLVPRDAGWKIAHEHTSAPIDFDSFKPIVER